MDPDYIKIMQDLQADKEYQKEVNRIIEKEFNKIKNQYLQEFLNHPITQEIKGGIDATNTSGTLAGITNLYSFIGFDEGSDPIKPIEDLLEKSNYRIIFNNKRQEVCDKKKCEEENLPALLLFSLTFLILSHLTVGLLVSRVRAYLSVG